MQFSGLRESCFFNHILWAYALALLTIRLPCSENSQTTRTRVWHKSPCNQNLSNSPEIHLCWTKHSILSLADFTDEYPNQHCRPSPNSPGKQLYLVTRFTLLCFIPNLIEYLYAYFKVFNVSQPGILNRKNPM